MRGSYRCTSCGAYFKAARKLCGFCGTSGVETDRDSCPSCGTSFSDSAHQQCPRCGSSDVDLIERG